MRGSALLVRRDDRCADLESWFGGFHAFEPAPVYLL